METRNTLRCSHQEYDGVGLAEGKQSSMTNKQSQIKNSGSWMTKVGGAVSSRFFSLNDATIQVSPLANSSKKSQERQHEFVVEIPKENPTSVSSPRKASSPSPAKISPQLEDIFKPQEPDHRTMVMRISLLDLDEEEEEESIGSKNPTPILKDFFARDHVSSKGFRTMQLEKRRENLYKLAKKRQDLLRQTKLQEAEQQESKDHKQIKLDQLKKKLLENKAQLRRETSVIKNQMVTRVKEQELQFENEKANWEKMFEEEIQVLTAAYRKTQQISQDRPITAAGLILPQANLQLEREMILNEKRLHTAPAHSRTGLLETKDKSELSSDCPIVKVHDDSDVK